MRSARLEDWMDGMISRQTRTRSCNAAHGSASGIGNWEQCRDAPGSPWRDLKAFGIVVLRLDGSQRCPPAGDATFLRQQGTDSNSGGLSGRFETVSPWKTAGMKDGSRIHND